MNRRRHVVYCKSMRGFDVARFYPARLGRVRFCRRGFDLRAFDGSPHRSTKHQLINVQVGLEVPSETEVAYQVVQQKFQSVSHDPLNDSCAQTRPLNH